MDGDLPKDNSSSAGVSPSLEIMDSFPLLWTIGCLARSPSRTSFQNPRIFLLGTATDHSHVTSVQRELVPSTFVSLAPPTSSPSPDANGGTDLRVFNASDCSTLRLLQVDWMPNGESKEV